MHLRQSIRGLYEHIQKIAEAKWVSSHLCLSMDGRAEILWPGSHSVRTWRLYNEALVIDVSSRTLKPGHHREDGTQAGSLFLGGFGPSRSGDSHVFEMHAHSESDIVGSQIRVQKLTKSARYNGSLATVDGFDRRSHRYAVKLEGSPMLKMIQPG